MTRVSIATATLCAAAAIFGTTDAADRLALAQPPLPHERSGSPQNRQGPSFSIGDVILNLPAAGPVSADVTSGSPTHSFHVTFERSDARAETFRQIEKLRKQLAAADTDEGKVKLQASLREAVGKYFDQDMQHRRKELQRLQARAEETAALLEKRESMKDELIDLQLQSYVNQAEGLGLFNGRNPGATTAARDPFGGVALPGPPTLPAGSPNMSPGVMPEQTPQTMIRRERPPTVLEATAHGVPPVVEFRQQQRIREAIQRVRAAESDEQKSEAKEHLRDALEAYFDADMQRRREEFEAVKKGLANLQSQLATRDDRKDEIVDLQLKLVVNDAEGLGFFAAPDRRSTVIAPSAAPARIAEPVPSR